MNDIGYSVIWMLATHVVLYIVGAVYVLKNRRLYTRTGIIISFLMVFCPFLMFTLIPFLLKRIPV